VGIIEMRQANPRIGFGRISPETTIIVPTQNILPPKKYRSGIVINIAELRLYYFSKDGEPLMSFPIALGRTGWSTPIGHTYVVRKQENPPWNVPKSIREYTYKKTGKKLPAVVPSGPDNPLGYYAIYLGLPGYLIHGNNNPASIGRLVSSGCIRLHNKDIAELYQQVGKRTLVHIIYYPNKAGWAGNYLYLESHYPITHEKRLYAKHALSAQQVIQQATRERPAKVDWNQVKQVVKQRLGVPIIIGVSN
jgi:L,D-transpeptidase ErfK/SrfK